MFNAMIETLKANPRKIVFTEGHDARILEATDRLVKGGFLTPILIGNVDVVKANAAKGGYNIEGVEIIDPETYPEMDAMVDKMVELRKGKMTADECRKALSKGNYFGTMLVKMGYADSLLGGATYSTADTVRPALQIVKTKKGAHLVSSCFILVRGDGAWVNSSRLCPGRAEREKPPSAPPSPLLLQKKENGFCASTATWGFGIWTSLWDFPNAARCPFGMSPREATPWRMPSGTRSIKPSRF